MTRLCFMISSSTARSWLHGSEECGRLVDMHKAVLVEVEGIVKPLETGR